MSVIKYYGEESGKRLSEVMEQLVKPVDLSRVSVRLVGNPSFSRNPDFLDRLVLPNLKTSLEARARFRIDKEWLAELGKPFAASLSFLSHQKTIRDAFERDLEAQRMAAIMQTMGKVDYSLDGFNYYPYTPFSVLCPEHSLRVPGIYKITSPKLKDLSKSSLLYGQFPFVYYVREQEHG